MVAVVTENSLVCPSSEYNDKSNVPAVVTLPVRKLILLTIILKGIIT